MLPAFAHVGAARALADGVQVERAHDALQFLIIWAAEKFHAQPGRTRVRCVGGGAPGGRFEMMLNGEAIRVVLNHVFYADGCAGTTVSPEWRGDSATSSSASNLAVEIAQVFLTACRYRR